MSGTRFALPDDLTKWPPENDLGSCEYKSKLPDVFEPRKMSRLITQMKWRLAEGADLFGSFECVYVLGLYDGGQAAGLDWEELSVTVDVIEEIAGICDAVVTRMTFADTGEGRLAVLYIKGVEQPEKRYLVYRDEDLEEEELEDEEDLSDIID